MTTTKKEKRRSPKPRPLMAGGVTLARVRMGIAGPVRLIDIQWPTLDAKDARRLNAWLPGAIAWCEERDR